MWDYIWFVAKLSLAGAFLCFVAALVVQVVKSIKGK